MNERVFTVNNHYLSHLSLLIREMGPLRSFSCRSMERTIKKYTNLIKSTTKTGVNASNVLRWQANLNKTAVQQLLAELFPITPEQENMFETSPCGSLQVWGLPKYVSLVVEEGNEDVYGTTKSKLKKGLERYYIRKTGIANITLDTNEINVFNQAWTDENVLYSSSIHRRSKGLTTRADNVVLFDAVVKSGRT